MDSLWPQMAGVSRLDPMKTNRIIVVLIGLTALMQVSILYRPSTPPATGPAGQALSWPHHGCTSSDSDDPGSTATAAHGSFSFRKTGKSVKH